MPSENSEKRKDKIFFIQLTSFNNCEIQTKKSSILNVKKLI